MNEALTMRDLITYLKDNKKNFIFSFLLSVLLVAGIGAYSLFSDSREKNLSKIELSSQKEFNFILENKEGNIFSNSNIVKSNLIYSFPNYPQLSYENKKKLSKVISVEYKDSTGFLTVKADEKELKNNTVLTDAIEKIFNKVKNNEVDFFKDKFIYLMDESPIISSNYFDLNTQEEENTFGIKNLVMLSSIWLFLGLVISLISIFLKNYSSKNINEKFYLSNENTLIDLSDPSFVSKENLKKDLNYLIKSSPGKSILVSEIPILEIKADDTILLVNNLNEIQDNHFQPNEIFIAIFKDKTTKKWYRMQKELVKNYQCTIKNVYIN